MWNEDYKEMLWLLGEEGVRFLLVGAYAMAAHGYPRATMDIDIWVKPSEENAPLVMRALKRFEAPLFGLTLDELNSESLVFQIGVAPRRIDIMTSITGLRFDEAYLRSKSIQVDSLTLQVLSLHDLLENKKSTGRLKDLADVEELIQIIDQNERKS